MSFGYGNLNSWPDGPPGADLDADAQDVTPSLDSVEEEVRSGLPTAEERLECAKANEDFYQLRNALYVEKRDSEEGADFARRPKRTSKLTRKAVTTLTSLLYSPGPSRAFEGLPAGAEELIAGVYAANHVNALMQRADRKATLNDCCALQAVGTGDPKRPVRLYLWGADEFEPFFRDDDPTTPWAVCTRSLMRQGGKAWRRYELWSKHEHRVYTTKPVDWLYFLATASGTRADYRPDLSGTVDARGRGDGANPYGVLPFAFVWNETPVDRFWGSGIGSALRDCNAEVDRELSDLAEHVQKFLNPRLFLRNVSGGFRWRDQPGRPTHLPPRPGTEGEVAPDPDIFALQVQLAVEETWLDAEKYANQTFYELDVPLSAVRQDQSGPTSGIQIIAEQAPLLAYTKARQAPFAQYERGVAQVILAVAGGYYEKPEWAAAAENVELRLTWPEPAVPVPSPETDDADDWELARGVTSLVDIIARRRGVTRDQAMDVLKQVAKDREEVAEIFGTDPTQPTADAADVAAAASRAVELWKGDLMKLGEARAEVGLETDPDEGDIYYSEAQAEAQADASADAYDDPAAADGEATDDGTGQG
jgi:hypothetical protein